MLYVLKLSDGLSSSMTYRGLKIEIQRSVALATVPDFHTQISKLQKSSFDMNGQYKMYTNARFAASGFNLLLNLQGDRSGNP